MSEEVDAVAVVGLAMRVPGAADRYAFWSNMAAGIESLSTLDEISRPDGPGTWVPVKGVLDGAAEFDAEFFDFSPREAEITDPQHRVFLQLVWHALEDAGHAPSAAGRVGVFASATQSRYGDLLHGNRGGVDDLQTRIATESDFLATRVAYKLDLRGPAVTIQTACSSSLVAVHMAANSLLSGDCDTVIAGGITITLPLRSGYWHQSGSILSPDGRCRAFDAAAAGTVPGNGGAAVVLRRLDDALADGDAIYAVILGSAITNDGNDKIGFTAPGGVGQYEAITRALTVAGVPADAVGMIEAHGTGTALGDPIEAGALRRVFGQQRSDGSWCGLSATKSNIGHLDAAAGIVGFVKAVLAVQAGAIPPVAGFSESNPDLQLESGPLRVVTELTPWPVAGRRIAGVSAFGVGGTNAHVVIAEAPRPPDRPLNAEPARIMLNARTPAALDVLAESLASHLEEHQELSLSDVAFTLTNGRAPLKYQRTVIGDDRSDLIAQLRAERMSVQVDPATSTVPAVERCGRMRVHLPGYPFQRQRYWADVSATEPTQRPTDYQEDQPPDERMQAGTAWLVEIFAEVLGRVPQHDSESFFDLGGDSLMAIQLISRVHATVGIEPDLEQFFDSPTVAGVAAQLSAASAQ